MASVIVHVECSALIMCVCECVCVCVCVCISLFLIGCVFINACRRSGYERYNAMRADPDLCFLERVGMPDVTALTAEQGGGEGAPDMTDR